jgi:hypothetical protein
MQNNSIDQPAGIMQDELLTILEQSGRPNFTKRRLTQLTSKGLLPPLRRTTQAGSNKPAYVWERKVIEQATYLYDLIEQGNDRYQIFLALWLGGFEAPFEPILRRWLRSIDTLLHNLTGGAQDPEDALWQISSSLVQYVEPKWKFSPRPDEVIRDVGIDAWREFMEYFLDVFAVPEYKPDETLSEGVRGTLRGINKIAQANADPEETLSWILSLREIFSLPRYRNALMNATVEEWTQARDDYLTLCQLLHKLAAAFPRRNALFTEEMRQTLFLYGGSVLPPLLLCVRNAGYGDRIDEALAGWSEVLNAILIDPSACKLLAKM